jgi:hypothetical protein
VHIADKRLKNRAPIRSMPGPASPRLPQFLPIGLQLMPH